MDRHDSGGDESSEHSVTVRFTKTSGPSGTRVIVEGQVVVPPKTGLYKASVGATLKTLVQTAGSPGDAAVISVKGALPRSLTVQVPSDAPQGNEIYRLRVTG